MHIYLERKIRIVMLERQTHCILRTISENSADQDTKKDAVQEGQKKGVRTEEKFLFLSLSSATGSW